MLTPMGPWLAKAKSKEIHFEPLLPTSVDGMVRKPGPAPPLTARSLPLPVSYITDLVSLGHFQVAWLSDRVVCVLGPPIME